MLALANGLDSDPVGAMEATCTTVRDLMQEAHIAEAFRFTAVLTDGESLTAFRWACDGRPPSLYYRESERGLTVVSEPIDGCKEGWTIVPKGGTLRATRGSRAVVSLPRTERAAA